MAHLKTPYGQLYYDVVGTGKETVLFLNGVMASANSWDFYKELLVKHNYQVITFDFIGQLLSDKPEGPYTFDQHVDEVIHLLDHLKIESAHFIGTSYGSEVALKSALLKPERVKSLILIDGTAEIDEKLEKEIKRWSDLTYEGGEAFFWGMAPAIYHEDWIQEHKEFLAERAKRLEGAHEYLKGQRYLYETFLNEVHFLNELYQIDKPTLVVVGDEDTLKTVDDSFNIHNQIKNSEMIILPRCGHVSIFERPHELATSIVGFLTKITRANL